MQSAEDIIRGGLKPRRWARIQSVLEQRLGAVRVVLEDLHHPHNMSAVLRSCDAFGVQYVHAVEEPENFTVSRRITLGTQKWLTLRRHDTIAGCAEELRGAGFRLFAAVLNPQAVPLDRIPVDTPVALVFGNERAGVSSSALDLCDGSYTIPMLGFAQSLNISVAAAISLYSLTARVRQHRPDRGLLTAEEKARVIESWLPRSARWGQRAARALGEELRSSTQSGETPYR